MEVSVGLGLPQTRPWTIELKLRVFSTRQVSPPISTRPWGKTTSKQGVFLKEEARKCNRISACKTTNVNHKSSLRKETVITAHRLSVRPIIKTQLIWSITRCSNKPSLSLRCSLRTRISHPGELSNLSWTINTKTPDLRRVPLCSKTGRINPTRTFSTVPRISEECTRIRRTAWRAHSITISLQRARSSWLPPRQTSYTHKASARTTDSSRRLRKSGMRTTLRSLMIKWGLGTVSHSSWLM